MSIWISRVVACCVLALCSPAALAQRTIERLAPENTVVILGSRSLQMAIDRFHRTSLGELAQSEQLKSVREQAFKQLGLDAQRTLEDLGIDRELLAPPTGPVGLAVFPVMDDELGLPQIGVMFTAEWGESAERLDHSIMNGLRQAQRKGDIDLQERDVAGRTVHVIDMSKIAERFRQRAREMAQQLQLPVPMPDPDDLARGLTKLYYLRDGGTLLVCTDFAAMKSALENFDVPASEGLAQREDFKAIMAKIGENDLYGVLLTRDVMKLVAVADASGMAGMMQPMLRSVLGEVQGYGYSLRLDAPTAMVEHALAVHMPKGKQGLSALLDKPAPRAALPPFAGADTVRYLTLNFEFRRVMDVLRPLIEASPAAEVIKANEALINQLTSALGSQVHALTTATRPFTQAAQQSVTAIKVEQPQEFENAFAGLTGELGLESRDFLGQRIFSMKADAQMMPGMDIEPQSVGIGGGYVLIGATKSVEAALRATSQPAPAGLAGEPSFRRAVEALGSEPLVAWGYTDTVDELEASVASKRTAGQMHIEQMRKWDEDTAREMQADFEKSMAPWNAVDWNLLRSHIGPTVWQVRSMPDGFNVRVFLLAGQ